METKYAARNATQQAVAVVAVSSLSVSLSWLSVRNMTRKCMKLETGFFWCCIYSIFFFFFKSTSVRTYTYKSLLRHQEIIDLHKTLFSSLLKPTLRNVDIQQRELQDKQWGSRGGKETLTLNSPCSGGASGSGLRGAGVWLSPSSAAILIAAIFAGVTRGSKWSPW